MLTLTLQIALYTRVETEDLIAGQLIGRDQRLMLSDSNLGHAMGCLVDYAEHHNLAIPRQKIVIEVTAISEILVPVPKSLLSDMEQSRLIQPSVPVHNAKALNVWTTDWLSKQTSIFKEKLNG